MHSKNGIILLIILLLYTIVNTIGFEKIPPICMIIFLVTTISLGIYMLRKKKIFKKNSNGNIYFLIFFITTLISGLLILLDYILSSINIQYSRVESKIVVGFAGLLCICGIVVLIVGAYKIKKENSNNNSK